MDNNNGNRAIFFPRGYMYSEGNEVILSGVLEAGNLKVQMEAIINDKPARILNIETAKEPMGSVQDMRLEYKSVSITLKNITPEDAERYVKKRVTIVFYETPESLGLKPVEPVRKQNFKAVLAKIFLLIVLAAIAIFVFLVLKANILDKFLFWRREYPALQGGDESRQKNSPRGDTPLLGAE